MSQDDIRPTELLFDKHITYVANHGNDKNDFVNLTQIDLN